MKNIRKFTAVFVFAAAILVAIFFIPQVWLIAKYSPQTVENTEQVLKADAALVFGAHLDEEGEPSEILQERLDAAAALHEAGKAAEVIVSNMAAGAGAMEAYLLEAGVPDEAVVRDNEAFTTPDTCRKEAGLETDRVVVFVSQGYHLPRVMAQCEALGVTGQGFAAEAVSEIDRSSTGIFARTWIRVRRFVREAALSWLVLTGVYR